jgi:type II restriction enzyme
LISEENLITTQENINKGFLWQARKKRELSQISLKQSRDAKTKLKKATSFEEIYDDQMLFDFLVGALMLSKKSINNLSFKNVKELIESEINFQKLNEQNYINSLEKNYLLMCGESIGGKMRNRIGKKGEELFIEKIKYLLDKKNVKYEMEYSKIGNPISIFWNNRTIIFNKKSNFINKSVDFIVLRSVNGKYDLENPDSYCCAGELKSGIDPAGADEHWKTAMAALKRISFSFKSINLKTPPLYFIGGAISNFMATEIIDLLKKDKLQYAANLNHSKQLERICDKILFN